LQVEAVVVLDQLDPAVVAVAVELVDTDLLLVFQFVVTHLTLLQ
jgi:hypothetical protein|tara:strand:- start:306 stop:437 length:132 start_codon:yes stop_codon:yes gene_type:complete